MRKSIGWYGWQAVCLLVVTGLLIAGCTTPAAPPAAEVPTATPATAATEPPQAAAQLKEAVKLTYWTHFDHVPEVVECYQDAFQSFAAERGIDASLEAVIIPYSGYETKYRAAFEGGEGPDIFVGMAADWLEFVDQMPADLAKEVESGVQLESISTGVVEGARYGIPIEGMHFQMLYLNADMFNEAGLDPSRPPKDFNELLEYAQKLTEYDGTGKVVRAGFAVRHKGNAIGLADKFLPFAHGFGARMLSEDGRNAEGFLNGPKMVEALTWYGNLVHSEKPVASVEIENPLGAVGGGQATMMLRESFAAAWLKENAPAANFKIYPAPLGPAKVAHLVNLFPWADLVNKNSPNKELAWQFLGWYFEPQNELALRQCYGAIPVRKEGWESDYVKEHPAYSTAVAMLQEKPGPSYDFVWTNEVAVILGDAISEVLFGQSDAQTALDNAAQLAQRAIDRQSQ